MNEALLRAILVPVLRAAYESGGRGAIVRMLTIPEKDVRKICAKSGADFVEALKARNEWAEKGADFAEELFLAD